MASITSQLVVRLIDQVSGPATAAGNALRRLVAQSNARGGAGLTALGQQLQTIQTRSQAVAQRATSAVATAAVPAAIGVAAAYQAALGYSRELNRATAIGELTEAQRRDVSRTAREIGASTQFTAAQAVAMQRVLIAAGRTAEQAQGMARPILNTALFGDTSPEIAADGVIAITSAYRMQMRTLAEAQAAATRVGDIVAKASNESRANFTDVLEGFKYAAPIANAAGWSMEQVAAAIGHMTNNGLRGNEAGVALRSMLVRMVRPTSDARQAMAELGLSFDQFFGRRKEFHLGNFSSGMRQAGHALSEAQRQQVGTAVARNAALPADQQRDLGQVLTEAMISALNIPEARVLDRQKIARAVQRYATSLAETVDPDALFKALQEAGVTPGQMSRIFDTRQGSRLMTLLGPEYAAILEKIMKEAQGASERGAARMEEGLYGAHKRIQSAIEAVVLSIADSGIADRIAETFTKIAAALREMSQTDPGTLRAIGYAMMGLAAAAPVGLALIGVAAVFKTVAAAAGLLAAVMAPVAVPILAVGAALAGLAVYAYRNWDGLTSFASSFASTIAEKFPNVAAAIGWVGTKLGELATWFDGLIGKSSASTEQWASWGRAAATAVSDAVDAVTGFATRMGTAFATGLAGIATKVDEVVTYVATLPQRMAAAVGQGAVSLYEAGARLMQSLLDGIKAKVAELMAYVQGIPGRIAGALGSIRIPGFGGGSASSGASQGPARASGGRVNAGTVYGVGERGREIFVPDSNGTVLGNRGRAGASGGSGSTGRASVTVSAPVTVTIQGNADKSTVERVFAEMERRLAASIRAAQADYGPSFT